MNPKIIPPPKSGKRFPFPGTCVPAAVFVFIALVYWRERSRGPGWGDSLGFLLSSLQGFAWTVNATGHFLYNTLIAALVRLLPRVDPVPLLTAVSILFALLTLARIYQTTSILVESRFAALMGVIAFGLSFTFWRQAEWVEVYTCATFFTASAVCFMLADTKTGDYRHIAASGMWFGLAVLVHIQTVLLLPLFLIYLVQAYRTTNESRTVLVSLVSVLCGFLLLMIPAAMLPEYTVGSVFFSFGFREEVFHFSIRSVLAGFGVSIAYLLYAFHIHIPAVAAGFFACRRSAPGVFMLNLAGILPVWLFAMRYPVTDQYVFFLNAYLFIAVMAAYGYRLLAQAVSGGTARAAIMISVLAFSAIAYETPLAIGTRIPQLSAFNRQKSYKGGLAYFLRPGLRTIPRFTAAYREWTETGIPPGTVEPELWSRLSGDAQEYYFLLEQRKEQ